MRTKIVLALAVILALVAAGLGVHRIRWHAAREVEVRTAPATLRSLIGGPGSTEESVRLAEARLPPLSSVLFELCARDEMAAERWAGTLSFAIWRPESEELMSRTTLNADVLDRFVQRDGEEACLFLGSGVIEHGGRYAVEALWDGPHQAVEGIPLSVRIAARRPLAGPDFLAVALGLLSAVFTVLAFFLGRAEGDPAPKKEATEGEGAAPIEEPELEDLEEAARMRAGLRERLLAHLPSPARVLLAVAFVILVWFATGFSPGGAAAGLVTGLILAGSEVLAAWFFADRVNSDPLGGSAQGGEEGGEEKVELAMRRPARWYLWVPTALLSGVGLVVGAQIATRLIRSTGRSPVETFVSWPSGMLSFATLAVFAPIAEELFFRGLLYSAVGRIDKRVGFAAAWLLFSFAHALQTWGNWGALVAILFTGLVLTTLRAASRSVLVPMIAHLVYNGYLALMSMG